MSNGAPRKQTQRAAETRARDVREYTPPSVLPEIEDRDGKTHRWIRKSVLGESDPTNVSQRQREGWVPVKPEEYPELHGLSDTEGMISMGGLILMCTDIERMEARQRYFDQLNAQQMHSADQNFMRQSDPRMPVLEPERRSKVTFGSEPG